jgi:ATP-binding cassette subfamily C (CFTR/MRP) protein 4
LLEEIVKEPFTHASRTKCYLYALGVVLTGLATTVCHHTYYFTQWRAGSRLRAAATGLLMDKSLKMRLDSQGAVSTGQLISLASGDVERFIRISQFTLYLFFAPFEASACAYLLWREVGPASLVGIAIFTLFAIMQAHFGKRFGRLRGETAALTDKRVQLAEQILSGIRVIKMYAWEIPFAHAVAKVRGEEVRKVAQSSTLRGLNEGLFTVGTTLTLGATFFVYWGLGHSLTPRKIFTATAIYNFLQLQLTKYFPFAIEGLAELLVSLARIQKYLLLPEREEGDGNDAPSATAAGDSSTSDGTDAPAIEANGLWCSWDALQAVPTSLVPSATANEVTADSSISSTTVAVDVNSALPEAVPSKTMDSSFRGLQNVSFSVPKGELVCVTGHVGSYKSTLLMALLSEVRARAGSATVRGRIAYTSQLPWLMSASVRENVTMGLPFDEDRYRRVLAACSLDIDVDRLSHKDHTIIGERGVNLSGGQRARVGLARACYADADVYLLDDVLAALDTRVGRQVFENCICGLLANKTRLFVTHQLQFIAKANQTLVLDHGELLARGSYLELRQMALEGSSASSPRALNRSVGDTSTRMFSASPALLVALGLRRRVESTSSHPGSHSRSGSLVSDYGGIADEEGENDTEKAESAGDAECAINNEQEESSAAVSGSVDAENKADAAAKGIIQTEIVEQGSIGWGTYTALFRAGGGASAALYLLVLLLAGSGSFIACSVWIARWSQVKGVKQNQSLYPAVYGGLIATACVLSIWRAFAFFQVLVKASRALHDESFSKVLRAPVRFFDSNILGRILNRFSKDVGTLDDSMPMTFFDLMNNISLIIGVISLVSVLNPYVIISLPPLIFVFVWLRRYYMRTGRVVKRIEAIARSPIYALMTEYFVGLSTIRAFSFQKCAWEMYAQAANRHMRSYFVFLVTSRWLGVRLDLICLVYLAVAAFASVASRDLASPSLIGLSLTQIISITGTLQWTVRQSAEVENQMVSVERLMEYTQLETEAIDLEDADISKGKKRWTVSKSKIQAQKRKQRSDTSGQSKDADSSAQAASHDIELLVKDTPWPTKGEIQLTDVSMRYRDDLPSVLNGLSLCIPSACKVSIVGRSGAGKSSFFAALLRLTECDRNANGESGILIDGVDVAAIPLTRLRRACAVIPQEPTAFRGTIRSNIDPFDAFSEEECWTALDVSGLKGFIESIGGLDADVAEGGSNLSVGQRQLLCLARSVLRRSKIILIDEATAAVDEDTTKLIMKTIKNHFRYATVITIAHRLATVIDSDLTVVMENGTVAEMGTPKELLSNKNGPFSRLVEDAGPAISARLRELAEKAAE